MNQRLAASEITTPAPAPRAPDLNSPLMDAIGEALANAEGYAAAGTRFAAMGDLRGVSYSVRSAAACIGTAAELLSELTSPSNRGGRKP